MSKKLTVGLLGCASVVNLALIDSAQAQTSAGSTAAEVSGSSALEEVVVTAQRREELLQDVPISVTAFTASSLEANRIQDVTDLNGLVPNMIIALGSPGLQAISTTIRGLVSFPLTSNSQKGVSLYLDGVYLSANDGSIFDVADLTRIEVLKGPQGTLFGRNSNGGAISLTTAEPTGVLGAKETLTGGNYNEFRSRTKVDLPQWGPFSINLTYTHDQRDGDIKNLGAGTVWNYGLTNSGGPAFRTSPATLGAHSIDAFSTALKIDATSDLKIIYRFDYTHDDFTSAGIAPVTGLFLISPPPFGLGATPAFTSTRPDAVNNDFTTPSRETNYGHNLTTTYSMNDVVSLKDILGIRYSNVYGDTQLGAPGGITGAAFGFPTALAIPFGADTAYAQGQLSNEASISIVTNPITFTGGYLYFRDQSRVGGLQDLGALSERPGLTALIFPVNGVYTIPAGAEEGQFIYVASHSNAVYGQAEYHVTSEFDLVAGARNTWDYSYANDNIGGPAVTKTSKPTYLAGANYHPSTDVLLYGKYSTGYISGGVFDGTSFEPETAVSYETGIKSEWLQHILRTNLALFEVTYNNLQQADQIDGKNLIVNSGKARAYGLEFEGLYNPLDGVTLGANLGYTDFRFLTLSESEVPAPGQGHFNVKRPTWTSNLNAQYVTHPILWGGRILVRGDGDFVSKTHYVPSASGLNPYDTIALTTAPAHWVANGRLALTEVPIMGFKGQVALWSKNIFNNRSIVGVSNFTDAGFIGANFQPARTFGIDVSMEY